MDYEKLYRDLIESRKNRILNENEYYEKHHIVPKCLGGNNKKENLIYLTAREHFLAHHLLYKCAKDTNEREKLGCALHYLCYGNSKQAEKKITARQYEISKKILIICKKDKIMSNETKEKIGKKNLGKKRTDEQKENYKGNKNGIGNFAAKGKIWISNINENNMKMIYPEEYSYYADNGWIKGNICKKQNKLSKEQKERISTQKRGNAYTKNKIWVHHKETMQRKMVYQDQIPQDFVRGYK